MNGYILLESLVALAVLVALVSLILGEFSSRRQVIAAQRRREEVLNLAVMAVQTGQSSLSLNGVSVSVERTDRGIRVLGEEGEIVYVAIP